MLLWSKREAVAASGHLSLQACKRSLFPRRLSIDSRAYVISQHAHWPIRTPRSTCANQDAWVVITPKRPRANSTGHERQHVTPFRKQYNTIYILPPHLSALGHRAIFDLGGSRHGWGLFVEQTNIFQGPHRQHSQTAGKLTTWATKCKEILEPHSGNGTVWGLVYLSTFWRMQLP